MAAGWWGLGGNVLMDQGGRSAVVKPNLLISCMKLHDFILVLDRFLIVVFLFYLFVLET